MTPLQIALARNRRQQSLIQALLRDASRLWRAVDRNRISESWSPLIPRLLLLLSGIQWIAAREADRYVTDVLDAQGIDARPVGVVNPVAFTGIASDGRGLDTLLYQPVITTKLAIDDGATETRAMSSGWATLALITATQAIDAFRVSSILAGTTRPEVDTYVRALNPPSCSRCVVLAGAYSWSTAYQRHPKCDCIAVPTKRDGRKYTPLQRQPGWDRITNSDTYFKSLPKAEQDRVFTKAGAQAIRDGADLNRVVNARRKAAGLTPAQANLTSAERRALLGGRERGVLEADARGRFVTFEGTGRNQKLPARLMPETIYQLANENRDAAISLLRKYKYII